MKTLLFLLTVWGLLGLMQCSKKDAEQLTLNDTIKLESKKSTTVKAADSNVQFTVSGISDSRCPANLQCIWAGEATVDVELRDAIGAVQNASLCLGDCRGKNDSATVVLNTIPHWLTLLAVEPGPAATGTSSAQTASLRLTRQ
ncbi:hypothetical protein MTX78_19900 [Hymenobacter tibetensis]|uniref:Lipoprotein n=1 Tax=Hymenobacter tibetensis TaxID=497967 RepID=A0ABY4CZG4_9BACT|nr:hypothetical protein [Hymenobacter tibetensis]UOG74369.1 hypothetical protein MTX78_19900 [Hymenobacter tibetensis]